MPPYDPALTRTAPLFITSSKASPAGRCIYSCSVVTLYAFIHHSPLLSSTLWNQQLLVGGLANAPRRVVIKVTGTKNPSATGFNVAVDGFVVGR